uniref:Uncharacterized protein n=1 Tax=Arion vulgaris TaxID=1028688 RepID=A0A0B7BXR0_9EUPU
MIAEKFTDIAISSINTWTTVKGAAKSTQIQCTIPKIHIRTASCLSPSQKTSRSTFHSKKSPQDSS